MKKVRSCPFLFLGGGGDDASYDDGIFIAFEKRKAKRIQGESHKVLQTNDAEMMLMKQQKMQREAEAKEKKQALKDQSPLLRAFAKQTQP